MIWRNQTLQKMSIVKIQTFLLDFPTAHIICKAKLINYIGCFGVLAFWASVIISIGLLNENKCLF
jgi:hypothetical protein